MSQWQKANPHATLTEMGEAIEAEVAKLRKQSVEEMVREKEAASQEVPDWSDPKKVDTQLRCKV